MIAGNLVILDLVSRDAILDFVRARPKAIPQLPWQAIDLFINKEWFLMGMDRGTRDYLTMSVDFALKLYEVRNVKCIMFSLSLSHFNPDSYVHHRDGSPQPRRRLERASSQLPCQALGPETHEGQGIPGHASHRSKALSFVSFQLLSKHFFAL